MSLYEFRFILQRYGSQGNIEVLYQPKGVLPSNPGCFLLINESVLDTLPWKILLTACASKDLVKPADKSHFSSLLTSFL